MKPQKIIVSSHPDNDAGVMIVPVDDMGAPAAAVVLGAGASHTVSFGEDHQMRVMACDAPPTVKADPIKVPKDAILSIARVAHEVNRAYCLSLGDFTQPLWEDAPNWQRASAMEGVKKHLQNPSMSPAESHAAWSEQKVKDGWVYGPVKDAEKKEHPCLVEYADLPAEQRAKDYLFKGVVTAIAREMVRP